MGRRAKGWAVRKVGGVYKVRFTYEGRQREFSTGEGDIDEASKRAAEKYAEVVLGQRLPRKVDGELDKLVADFLEEYAKNHAEKTASVVEDYFRAHIIPFFGELARLTAATCAAYARERLTAATRVTVRKELSALRQFASWAEMGVEVPSLPKHGHPGKRARNARKAAATILTEKQVEKVLKHIPLKSPRGGVWLRPFFRVLWETGLRESTLFRLRAPLHFRKGAKALLITRDIDKAFDQREVPLSAKAVEALASIVPESGVLFARFRLREPLERACRLAGVPVVSPYDIRHSRMTDWANSGAPLPGVQYLAGHKSLATTARYVQGQREAAERVLLGKR